MPPVFPAGFSRALGGMWAMGLLFLFVRIQLNILGRHVYIHTAAEDPEQAQVSPMVCRDRGSTKAPLLR